MSDRAEAVLSNAPSKKRPAPRGTASYPRKRGNTACQVCRARRTKCDRALPKCSFCEKTGAACVRSPVDLSSFDPASLHILERIDELTERFTAWSEAQSLARASQDQPAATAQPEETQNTSVRSWLFPRSAEQVLPDHILKTHLLTVLKADDTRTLGTPSSDSSVFAVADLDHQSVKPLLDSFFAYVHVKNPVLDEHSTRLLASRLVIHGIDWSAPSCLVLLICALGALAAPLDTSLATASSTAAFSAAHSYFLAAQKRLGQCVLDGGLVQAQCLFLAGVYLMTIFKPSSAWRAFSQALTCCQDFGFLIENHSCDYNASSPAWSDSMVAEQAVYWSAWKSEQELRKDLEPPDYSSQAVVEFPKFFPTPPAPKETDTDEQVKAWTFYLTEISLRRRAWILVADSRQLVNWQRHLDVDRLAHVLPERLTQIEDWLHAIPQPASLETPAEQDDICKFVLRGQVQDLYEILFCPFLNIFLRFVHNSEQDQINCAECATQGRRPELKDLAEKALSLHVGRIRANKPGFYHRHHGTWFMLRSCSRSATMLLRAAIHNEEASHVDDILSLPSDWHGAVVDVIELHRYWRSEASDVSFRLNVLEEMVMRCKQS